MKNWKVEGITNKTFLLRPREMRSGADEESAGIIVIKPVPVFIMKWGERRFGAEHSLMQ